MNIRQLVLLLVMLSVHHVSARDDSTMKGFGIESNLLFGKIIKHTKKFTAPIPTMSGAVDLNFVWQTYGKKEWHQRRNFPQIGLGITYTDYGNNNIFGKCISIYPNLQIPLLRTKNIECMLRIGDGIAYVNKKYDSSTFDTINNAIGSNINDFAIFMLDVRYNASDHFQFQAGANFTHISNAYFQPPNLGINMAGVHFGIRYFPGGNRPDKIIRDIPQLKSRWLLQLRGSIGFNEANATNNPHLPNYIFAGYISRRWLSKNKFFAGIDYAYHEPTYAFYKTYGIHIGHERSNAWDGTFFAGNEFIIGRVGIVLQVGYYYRTTYLRYGNDMFNEKLGGHLYLIQKESGALKELFISALVTTHTATAEYAEFGIGVGF